MFLNSIPLMSTSKELLKEIEAFMSRHDMKATTFGLSSCADPHVVRWLREGGGVTSTRIDKIKRFIRDYKPPKGGKPARSRRSRPTQCVA